MALLGSLIGFRSSSIQIYSQLAVRFVFIVRTDLVWLASDLINQFICLIPIDIIHFGLILTRISSAYTSLVRFSSLSSLRSNST